MIKRNITPKYILSVIERRWAYFLIPFVLVMVGVIATVFLWEPKYRSSAMILVESQKIPNDIVRSMVNVRVDQRLERIERRLRTRENLLRIVRKFGLSKVPKNKANEPLSAPVGWLGDRILIERVDVGSRRNPETIAIKVSFEHEQPSVAADVTNDLVTYIISEDVRVRASRVSETTKFLVQEQIRLERMLKSLERQISDFKIKNKDSLPEKLAYNLGVLERSQKRLQDVRNEIAESESKQKLIRAQAGVKRDTEDPAAQRVFEQLEELQLGLAKKENTLAETHPEIRRLRNEISALQQKLDKLESSPRMPRNDKSGTIRFSIAAAQRTSELEILRSRLESLRSEEVDLLDDITQMRAFVEKTPKVERYLNSLDREYVGLKSKILEITTKQAVAVLGQRLEANKQGDRFEVLEQATVPTSPVMPSRLLILLAGVVLAIGAGSALVIVLELVDDHIRSPQDLMLNFDIMPIVTIPNVSTSREAGQHRQTRTAVIVVLVIATSAGIYFVDQHYLSMSEFKDRVLNLVLMAGG